MNNIILIFGPLAFLVVFHTSVQGQVWPLLSAEIGNNAYNETDKVSLERNDDRRTWVIHILPKNLASDRPDLVYGPFEMRGFGPYSMLITKIWLNTSGDEKYVSVTFFSAVEAREFYRVLNPHHSPSFSNYFKVTRLVLRSSNGYPTMIFEEDVPKALDVFILETSTEADSRARSYVVHDTEGDEEPILIFHSLETEMTVEGASVMLSIRPQKSPTKYSCSIEFEVASDAEHLVQTYTTLKQYGCVDNLPDLEALPRNTYPSRPPEADTTLNSLVEDNLQDFEAVLEDESSSTEQYSREN